MKKAKDNVVESNPKFTSYTLWTAPSSKPGVEKYEAKPTPEMQEHFQKSLAKSKGDLKKKLETFEPAEISEAAARCVVK